MVLLHDHAVVSIADKEIGNLADFITDVLERKEI